MQPLCQPLDRVVKGSKLVAVTVIVTIGADNCHFAS